MERVVRWKHDSKYDPIEALLKSVFFCFFFLKLEN